mmetsp:Transcript_44373/g.125496  ORF Transcript_44373/g.125496 Transcript_44373/m.125496 type:complete len:225 (+) Transcript_44373:182-856(+)
MTETPHVLPTRHSHTASLAALLLNRGREIWEDVLQEGLGGSIAPPLTLGAILQTRIPVSLGHLFWPRKGVLCAAIDVDLPVGALVTQFLLEGLELVGADEGVVGAVMDQHRTGQTAWHLVNSWPVQDAVEAHHTLHGNPSSRQVEGTHAAKAVADHSNVVLLHLGKRLSCLIGRHHAPLELGSVGREGLADGSGAALVPHGPLTVHVNTKRHISQACISVEGAE